MFADSSAADPRRRPARPQSVIPLWDGKAPHAVGDSDADKPTPDGLHGREAQRHGGRRLPRRRLRLPRRRSRGQAGRRVAQHASASPRSCSSTASWRRTVPARSTRPRSHDAQRAIRLVRGQGEGLRHRPEASRHLGLLGRRAPRQYRGHALRRRRTRSATTIDADELPPGLRHPRVPGHHDGGRRDARRLEEQPARRRSPTRSWSNSCRTRSR